MPEHPQQLVQQLAGTEPATTDIWDTEAPVQQSTDIWNTDSSADRLDRVAESKNRAMSRLDSGASLQNSYTDMGDGWLESNANKMWNDMSDVDIQSLYKNVMAMALTTDEQGRNFNPDGSLYEGSTRRLYSGGTKEAGSDVYKLGVARSDRPSSAARYDPLQGGYASGVSGIDTDNFESDVLLPYGAATMLEAVSHGRKKAIEGRVVKDLYNNPNARALLGGGASEYYTSREALFGAPVDADDKLGSELFKEYMAKLPVHKSAFRTITDRITGDLSFVDTESDDYKDIGDRIAAFKADRGTTVLQDVGEVGERFSNTLSGFASSFVNELLVKPADAIGDLTGLYDLDTDGDTIKAVEEAFGYDPTPVQETMEKITGYWDVAANSEATTAERVRAAGNGILEALITPEMLGTSLGMLMSWVTPGVVLKGVGIGSKFANAAKGINASVAAGKITAKAGRVEKARAFMSVDGAKSFLTTQSGYITSSLGNVNKQYEEFVINNNGNELEGREKAEWFAGRFAVQMVNQNIDKIVDFKVMSSPGVLKALVPAVKAMTEKEFVKVVGAMVKGVAATAVAAGTEAVQEYTQTSLELFNSRFGSEQFSDLDTFTKFLSDTRNITEAGIASLAGAGGSMQFEAAGTLMPAVAAVSKFSSDKTAGVLADRPSAQPTEVSASEEEVKKAKVAYGTLLKRVRNETINTGVNEKNIGLLLEDLEELSATKHVIGTSSPEQIAAGEAAYDGVVKSIETFIQANPTLKLTKKLIRKTLKESAADAAAGTESDSTILGTGPTITDYSSEFEEGEYDDYSRKVVAEQLMRVVLGSRKDISKDFKNKAALFGIANGISKKSAIAIIKSYSQVEEEATSGARGYFSRLSRLKGLIESPTPSDKAINKEYDEIVRMHSSIIKSTQDLERGITEAKREAVSMNKFTTVTKNIKPFTTTYTKADGKPYIIHLKKIEGRWIADVKGAEGLVTTKTKYTKDIMKGLKSVAVRTSGRVGDLAPTVDKFSIPIKEYKNKESRQKDVKYIENIVSVLDEILPNNKGVSKVILGQKTTGKWSVGGAYHTVNESIVNSKEFAADDVVLLNSTELNTRGDKYSPAFGKEAAESMKAAVKAGSTFILDREMLKDSENWASAIAGYLGGKKSGYKMLAGKHRYVFIKESAATNKIISDRAAAAKVVSDKEKSNAKDKLEIVSIERALNSDIDPVDGSELSATRREELNLRQSALYASVVADSFKDNTENLNSFLEREPDAAVKKEAEAILKDKDAGPILFEDKAFEKAVEKLVVAEGKKDVKGAELLKSWKSIADEGLNSKDKEAKVVELLTGLGLTAKSLITAILGDKSFAKGKDDLYESLYQDVNTGEIRALPMRKNMEALEYDKLMAMNDDLKGHEKYGAKHIFLGTRRVIQDLTKIVDVKRTTVANSVPLDFLSFGIRDAVATFATKAKKALAEVSVLELAEQTSGKASDGSFNLHNSPARGLFFNNEGKVNEEVLTASYLAIGDLISNNKSSMSRGWKSDYDVAVMFGVEETEITHDMKQFAFENGSLLKTAATAVGKSIVAQLGIVKKIDTDTSANEFEALVADIGNTALLIAEAQGLLTGSKVDSNEMAKMYRDGVERKTDAYTHFLHISDVEDKSGDSKFTRNIPNEKAQQFIETYDEAVESIPEASTTRVEAYFTMPDENRLKAAKTVVRNDISGKQVPKAAQETIQILMETAYSIDMDRVNELLDAVNATGSNVKKQLGFIGTDSAEFGLLYYKDKEVQEAKNNAIDKTLNELVILKAKVKALETGDVELYFNYFYASNDRYMLDSNTVNPQVDKIHRFLIVPKGHKLDYFVTKNEKTGGIEFAVEHEETGNPEDSDQSFTVRMALTQAFGQDVDKMKAEKIIEFGNVMLSLDANQLSDVKKEMLNTGKLKITADGIEYTLKADHLTHTLQGLNFLDNVHKSLKGDGSLTSSLSLEFDSLTSGFANKIQQMPILDNMKEQFARTGLLTKEYQTLLQSAINFKSAGAAFDPKAGDSIADLIAIGDDGSFDSKDKRTLEFLDSYKTMAKITISKLQEGTKQLENLTQTTKKGMNSGASVFEIIKPLLPGGEFIDAGDVQIKITGAIRNLFKNPFMIFNYSAGIARIVKNLGNSVAQELAKSIATADFTSEKDAGIGDIAQNLVSSIKLVSEVRSDDVIIKTDIKTAADLQKALRNGSLSSIKLKVPFVVEMPEAGKAPRKVKTLEDLLESTVKATYGSIVQDVFKEVFGPFIEVQDAMNDTYKVAFRIFDKKRVDMLKEIQQTKPDRFLSVEDHAKVLDALWEDFPWIVGPLSGADNRKDVISVVTTAVSSPNVIEQSRKNPQALLGGKGNKSRTVSPLVKYLEEAMSSGSVLPFHAIDGAEISKTFNAMGINAMAAIHDAIIPPLNKSDQVGFEYNKGMVEINSDYVLADAMKDLVDRMLVTINKEGFDKEYKDVVVKGLKTMGNKSKKPFNEAARDIAAGMLVQVDKINKAREVWYGLDGKVKGSKMEGAWHGNLVGTPGGMYQRGMTKPNLSYKKKFRDGGLYTSANIEMDSAQVVETAVKTVEVAPMEDVTEFTSNNHLRQLLAREMENSGTLQDTIADLRADESLAPKLIETFTALRATKKSDTAINAINELIDNLSFYTDSPKKVVSPKVETAEITEDTSSADVNSIVSSAITDNLKDCK